jgi:hypothetical protein
MVHTYVSWLRLENYFCGMPVGSSVKREFVEHHSYEFGTLLAPNGNGSDIFHEISRALSLFASVNNHAVRNQRWCAEMHDGSSEFFGC